MNQSAKEVLEYVSFTFRGFGLPSLVAEDFRRAKVNDHPSPALREALALLVTLHISNFKDSSTGSLSDEAMFSHLVDCGCPVLDQRVGLQSVVSRGRTLLLALGWLMGVSNYFSRVRLQLQGPTAKSKPTPSVITQPKQGWSEIEGDILQVQRELQRRLESQFKEVYCLLKTRNKLRERLSRQLEAQNGPPVHSFLKDRELEVDQKKLHELEQRRDHDISGMRYRKQFWLWLQSVIELQRRQYIDKGAYGFQGDLPFHAEVLTIGQFSMARQTHGLLEQVKQRQAEIQLALEEGQPFSNSREFNAVLKGFQREFNFEQEEQQRVQVVEPEPKEREQVEEEEGKEEGLLQEQLRAAEEQVGERVRAKLARLREVRVFGLTPGLRQAD